MIALALALGASLAHAADDQAPTVPDETPFLEVAGRIPDVAERAVQSVVNIASARRVERVDTPYLQLFGDPLLRDLLGPPPELPSDRRQHSLGSGVIVREDGVVLTNHHVVEDADEIEVTLPGERGTWSAEVVGSDPKTDLAVLRLVDPPDDLVALPFGDAERLRLGEVVLAIGNPFGVGETVTMGIVSATGRADVGIVDYENFIQTDAPINPGNSGGALVNLRGELVGINTAIVSATGGSNGVGFAVPSTMARPILESILEDGEVERGWLGIALQELDGELAVAMGLPADQQGVLVAEVAPDSPAEEAGFQPGDVVVAFDGDPIPDGTRLRHRVAAAGETPFEATVLRDGEERALRGHLDLLDEHPAAGREDPDDARVEDRLSVAELTDELRRRYRIPPEVDGLVITAVAPGSRAARAGLVPGTIVLDVDGEAARDPDALERRLRRAREPVLLRVWRQGAFRFVPLGSDS